MALADYIGIHYADRGRDWKGVDCFGLVELFYKHELGIEIPNYLNSYVSSFDKNSVSKAIGHHSQSWQQVDNIEPNDVLIFRIMGAPSHCGLYLGDRKFLHAFNKCNTVIENLDTISWRHRLYGAFRWTTSS